ncbi:methionine ABC transporter permease [Cardiobacterium valvarum]|uniref:D-methionine transport system permease protein MetI n=1 Tax=Cardiobacterium valvarum F0432 TaxID=797473 RepID=G9ZEX1_9GAMM|nr:methionine ABC transporter permease [Cardiobacterium valvarum]EHM54291.1 D-methionine transport system permease protein MetI [Cardiobacterium valvarum F0432]
MLNNLLKLWHAISGWWDTFTTWLHALIGDTAWLMLVSACETLYMTLSATLIAAIFGTLLGLILYATRRGRFLANPYVYYPLGIIVNIGRSIPYIILALWIVPFTRFIVGVSIGNTAAIVPLTLSAVPFIARMVENMLNEVPGGLIEAAQAMGASPVQIMRKVLLPEALPGIINALTITLIALIGYSAIAGALGAGGLGKVAYAYGYQRYRPDIMLYTVCIIVVLVQNIQWLGDALARRFDHR